MSAIAVRGLGRTFPGHPPVAAVRDVDLDVAEGTLVAVLGPSGSGKTTLLRALAGLERADTGTVTLAGRAVSGPGRHVPPERRAVGLVPQEGALFPHLDVAGNVAFGLRGRPGAERRARVRELLELVGLGGLGRRRPHELSGGQQQRVALARALAPAPAVVLLDEPFSALDTSLRQQVRDEVAATLRATATTAVLVTHDQVEALTTADRVAVMREGTLVQEGTPAEVYGRPVDAWVAGFVGDAVLLPGRVTDDGSHVDTDLGRLPVADGARRHGATTVTAFCRPEQVHPAGPGEAGVDATVHAVRFQGPDAMVELRVGRAAVTARWPSSALPEPGAATRVRVEGRVLAF